MDPVALKQLYQPVFEWFERNIVAGHALQTDGMKTRSVEKLLASVTWEKGDAKRARRSFGIGCLTCHSGPSRLGPDLTA